MKQIIAGQDLVILGDDSFQVDCSPVRHQGLVFIGDDGVEFWAEADPFEGRIYDFDKGPAEAIFLEAQQIKDASSSDEDEEQTLEEWRALATISPAQGKVYLIQLGRWQEVLDYVDGIEDDTQRAIAGVALNGTGYWRRMSPTLLQAAGALEFSPEDVDDWFLAAATIEL